MRCIARWSIVTFFAASAAFAQTGGRPGEIAKLRADCGQEIQRLCRGVEPGGGRIVECLLSHRGRLTSACNSVLPAARASLMPNSPVRSMAPAYQARPAGGNRVASAGNFRAACGHDAQSLCAGASREDHGVFKCLVSHRVELSATCRSFFQGMRAHQAGQRNEFAVNPRPARPVRTASAAGNFRAACGGDAQSLCAGASREDHGVFKCLVSHRMELSATCRSFFQELRAHRAAQAVP
jgi:hypothetical protein